MKLFSCAQCGRAWKTEISKFCPYCGSIIFTEAVYWEKFLLPMKEINPQFFAEFPGDLQFLPDGSRFTGKVDGLTLKEYQLKLMERI